MNYHNLTYPDMNNGSGLRVVLWLSGCSHRCRGCQNPQTWDLNSGVSFDEAAKEELFRELDKDYISGITLTGGDPLFEENLDDVLNLVTEINKRYNTPQNIVVRTDNVRNIWLNDTNEIRLSIPQKSIWLYSGYEWEHIFDPKWHYHPKTQEKLSIGKWRRQQIVSQCDVFIDGEYIDSQRDITLKWRGSKNQNVINVQESLKQNKIVLYCE